MKTKNLIWIIALILVIVLIAGLGYGYYKKATIGEKKSSSNNGGREFWNNKN